MSVTKQYNQIDAVEKQDSRYARLLPQRVMPELKKLSIATLQIMITAHSSDYGRALNPEETIDRIKTIRRLQGELNSRKVHDTAFPLYKNKEQK